MAGYRAVPPSGKRPLLILGISDVVVLEHGADVPTQMHHVSAWGRWVRDVAIPVVAPTRIRELGEHFEIVWASEWGHNAHTAFREALELPEEPWAFLPVQFNKSATIERYAQGLPWAWIDGVVVDLDDEPDPAGVIVRVDPRRGLADVDAADLAARVAAKYSTGSGSAS